MDTVTLGHFPAPVVTAEHVASVNAAGKAAISSTKAFGKLSIRFEKANSFCVIKNWSQALNTSASQLRTSTTVKTDFVYRYLKRYDECKDVLGYELQAAVRQEKIDQSWKVFLCRW